MQTSSIPSPENIFSIGFSALRERLRSRAVGITACALMFGLASHAFCQDFSVLTHHNDNTRDGAQLNETLLTPQKIKAFGGLHPKSSGSLIKGIVNAQPLYVQGVPFKTGTSDAVYVVDSTNTVYAINPLENAQQQLVPLKVRTLEPATDSTTVDGGTGILSPPAIDKTRHLIYVVARAADSTPPPPQYSGRGNAKFILHV